MRYFLIAVLFFALGYGYHRLQWNEHKNTWISKELDNSPFLRYDICYDDKFNLERGEVVFLGFNEKQYKIRRVK